MKGIQVYHSVHYLRSLEYSIRDIACQLKISTGTVVKYLKIDEKGALVDLVKVKRKSEFDKYATQIHQILEIFPKISSFKLLRKLKEDHPEITCKERTLRSYLAKIRADYGNNPKRYYKPIRTERPGYQVQVDLGEALVLLDNHERVKVYFVAFIFGYSRQRFFYIQNRPFNTGDFINAHKEAFEYFGGVAKEYVYDQTKLVVINERYREVWLNNEFHQFALKSGFTPVVCEGYDPESKGKVERLVQYIKNDFFYGETFTDFDDVREKSLAWLERVNNQPHGTTNVAPIVLFNEEKKLLKPYIVEQVLEKRVVDKTGLISYRNNKYSVPYQYQQKVVTIKVVANILVIEDIKTGKEICRWPISSRIGSRNINHSHYHNYKEELSAIKTDCINNFKGIANAELLINRVIAENPKIQRGQLNGLRQLYSKYQLENWEEIIDTALKMQVVKTSVIEEIIRRNISKREILKNNHQKVKPVSVSKLDRSLEKYNEVIR